MNYYSNPKFLFGKYKGRAIANVPRDYLEWYVATTEGENDSRYRVFRERVIAQLQMWDRHKRAMK